MRLRRGHGSHAQAILLVLAAARIPRYGALAYLGATLGEHSGTWLRAHGWYLLALGVVLATALGLVVGGPAARRYNWIENQA